MEQNPSGCVTSSGGSIAVTEKKTYPEIRVIKIPRNESGYGFTLSRTYLSSDEQEDQLKVILKCF